MMGFEHLLAISVILLLGVKADADSDGWGPWKAHRPCTFTCGGGVQHQERECSKYGSCFGDSSRLITCNTQPCSHIHKDQRASQCAKYDKQLFEGRKFSWVPHYHGDNKCSLSCETRESGHIFTFKSRVKDGVSCDIDGAGVCVNAICRRVGCDGVVGSSKSLDACGVCGGDSSGCYLIHSKHVLKNHVRGNNDMFVLPVGATNIKIISPGVENHLILRSHKGDYLLGDGWEAQEWTAMDIAGTRFLSQRFDTEEHLTSPGPTKHVIAVVLQFLSDEALTVIKYQYYLPNERPKHHQSPPREAVTEYKLKTILSGTEILSDKAAAPGMYRWETGSWQKCSKLCGQGTQKREVSCIYMRTNTKMHQHYCEVWDKPRHKQPCNKHKCPANTRDWNVGHWSPCSVSCGYGEKSRSVTCTLTDKFTTYDIDDKFCQTERPAEKKKCDSKVKCVDTSLEDSVDVEWLSHDDCEGRKCWKVSEWGLCSVNCGEGYRRRRVACTFNDEFFEYAHCSGPMPEVFDACDAGPCYLAGAKEVSEHAEPMAEVDDWDSEEEEDVEEADVNQDSDVCHLERNEGVCTDLQMQMWYFIPAEGRCAQFWFGGCSEPSNVFETQGACMATCAKSPKSSADVLSSSFFLKPKKGKHKKKILRATEMPYPTDPCLAPQVIGPCRAKIRKFYFDQKSRQCELFHYGGCRGNENNFESQNDCEGSCSHLLRHEIVDDFTTPSALDPCLEPKLIGPCRAIHRVWYFDSDTSTCSRFDYGGCLGNGNRFRTEGECVDVCNHLQISDMAADESTPGAGSVPDPTPVAGVARHVDAVCSASPTDTLCTTWALRYFYNSETSGCEQFWSGLCGGENEFETLESCEARCVSRHHSDGDRGRESPEHISDTSDAESSETEPTESSHEVVEEEEESVEMCEQPKDEDHCGDWDYRWYYNSGSISCQQFWYGQCGKSQNVFMTEEECLSACGPEIVDVDEPELRQEVVEETIVPEVSVPLGTVEETYVPVCDQPKKKKVPTATLR